MYRPVAKVPDFPAMEREILRFWQERQIFNKLRQKNAQGPRWSFLDGPITANNPMGLLAVIGPSKNDQRGPWAFFWRSLLKICLSCQKRRISRSIAGKSGTFATGRYMVLKGFPYSPRAGDPAVHARLAGN